MSTKLYNGHEIVGHSLESFLLELGQLRKESLEQRENLLRQAVLKLATQMYDQRALGLRSNESNVSALDEAWADVQQRTESLRQSRRRDPEVDFEYTVCAIPVDGRLLALTFAEQPAFRQAWADKPWRRPFEYWNNTEAPEDIEQAEWEARGALWGKAFAESLSWTPAEVGYTYEVVGPGEPLPHIEYDGFELLIPSLQQRAKSVLMDVLLHERAQSGLPEPRSHSELMGLWESAHASNTLARLMQEMTPTPGIANLRAGR